MHPGLYGETTMTLATTLICLLWDEDFWQNRAPKNSELAILRAIKAKDVDRLKKYIDRPVKLRNIYNVRQDYQHVFEGKFSNAQLVGTYAFVVESGILTKKTPTRLAKKFLKYFGKAMESSSTGNFGQGYDEKPGDLDFGDYFPSHYSSPYSFDPEGLSAKIASGSYYSFGLGRRSNGSPTLVRCELVDHIKGIDFHWFNTFTTAFLDADQ